MTTTETRGAAPNGSRARRGARRRWIPQLCGAFLLAACSPDESSSPEGLAQVTSEPELRGTWRRVDASNGEFEVEVLGRRQAETLVVWAGAVSGDEEPARFVQDVPLPWPQTPDPIAVPSGPEPRRLLVALATPESETWWVAHVEVDTTGESAVMFRFPLRALPVGAQVAIESLLLTPPDSGTGGSTFLTSIETLLASNQPHIGGKVGFVSQGSGSYLSTAGNASCELVIANQDPLHDPVMTHVWVWSLDHYVNPNGTQLPSKAPCHSESLPNLHVHQLFGEFNCDRNDALVNDHQDSWLFVVVKVASSPAKYWRYVSQVLQSPENEQYRCVCDGSLARPCGYPCPGGLNCRLTRSTNPRTEGPDHPACR